MSPITSITEDALTQASQALRAGRLVAIPTETVYGLAALATSSQAVADIYSLKSRPEFNPLISHVSSKEQAEQFGVFSDQAHQLANAFWPGPLTLVMKKKPECFISDLVTAGLPTLALRVPDHAQSRALIDLVGSPLAAPSANPSQGISPTRAQDVAHAFKDDPRLAMILDGGPCSVGLESTIIDVSTDVPTLLRPGGLTIEQIQGIIGPINFYKDGGGISAPGQMKRHYAPSKPLRLNVAQPLEDEAYLCFGPQNHTYQHSLNLSQKACVREAACNLFYMMRSLDQGPCPKIAVQSIPMHSLGFAINDRLKRASA